jgi:EamA-like transporter family
LTSSASVTPEKRRSSLLIETSLVLTVLFFGTNFVAVTHVVESAPPILFAAVQFSFSGVLLWLLLRLVEPGSKLPLQKDFLSMLGLGVVGVTLTRLVFTVGVSLTTATNTALIYSSAPVWVCCSDSSSRWRDHVGERLSWMPSRLHSRTSFRPASVSPGPVSGEVGNPKVTAYP